MKLLVGHVGEERDFAPDIRRDAALFPGCVNAKAAIDGKNPSVSGFDEVVRTQVTAAAIAIGHAQIYGSTAFERSIAPRPKLPESLGIMCGDGIVRASQGCISADPEVQAAHQNRRIALQGPKSQSDQPSRSMAVADRLVIPVMRGVRGMRDVRQRQFGRGREASGRWGWISNAIVNRRRPSNAEVSGDRSSRKTPRANKLTVNSALPPSVLSSWRKS